MVGENMSQDWKIRTKSQEIYDHHRIQLQQDHQIMERIRWNRIRKITRLSILVSGILFAASIIGSYGVLSENVQIVEGSKLVIFGISAILVAILFVWAIAINFEEEIDQIRRHGFIDAFFMPNLRSTPYMVPIVLLVGMMYLLSLSPSYYPIILVFFGLVFFGMIWYHQNRLLKP